MKVIPTLPALVSAQAWASAQTVRLFSPAFAILSADKSIAAVLLRSCSSSNAASRLLAVVHRLLQCFVQHKERTVIMRSRVSWCALACVALFTTIPSTAIASGDSALSWSYQVTGFSAGSSGPGPQTALAMRDGQVWPVIFSYNTSNSSVVDAYSLYPVLNTSTNTYWHKIGSCYLNTSGGILSAATSSDGKVGFVSRMPSSSDTYSNVAVVGSSSTGFGTPLIGVRAIDFTSSGSLVTGTNSTIPTTFSPTTLVDVAVSPTGELGAIDDTGRYYQKTAWTGAWGTTNVGVTMSQDADLEINSNGKPYVVGNYSGSIVASSFDVATGYWTSQILSTVGSPSSAVAAADSRGGVGAAWVDYDSVTSSNVLRYAYNNGDRWTVHAVTNSIKTGSLSETLMSSQRVGLAYDANDLPVISFISNSGQIWLAYDPVTPVPEPSSLLLLIMVGLSMLVMAGKKRLQMLRGK